MISAPTIKRQVFFIASAPIIFIIISVSLFLLIDSLSDADKDVQAQGQSIVEQASLLSEFYFFTGDVDNIVKIAELLIDTNDLSFIGFYDDLGNLLAYKDNNRNVDKEVVFTSIIYGSVTELDDFGFSQLDQQPEELGSVVLGLHNTGLAAKKKYIYQQILLLACLGILGGLLLAYLFSRKLLMGLNSLLVSAIAIENKNFSKRCQENSSGEVLKIQKVFNNMAESIQLNEKMMQREIDSATESLNKTIQALNEKNIELDRTRKVAIDLERSQAILDERSRIMKDMHDGIGGQLVASLALIENEQDSAVRKNIHDILAACIDDLRLIINSLSASSSVLSALLADFKFRMNKRIETMGIRLDWRVDDHSDSIHLQPQQGLHILRILQEVFTNTLKHAQASTIHFRVSIDVHELVFCIEDDGVFLASGNAEESRLAQHAFDHACEHGHGIKNIKWRARQLGASISIAPAASRGCRVVLQIPLSMFSDHRPAVRDVASRA
ncbi:MAG: hypothetical protein KTR20_08355 [Cellvibrionaceae bacterium]|nr:hypothetical protein [Cellvibrionaceae bacterium]